MNKNISLFATIALISISAIALAQPTVKVEVSADTVMMGDLVELTYTIENGNGRFQPPDLSMLPVVSGPNSSSSMVYQNGKMSTSQSYSYILRPDKPGDMLIPETTYVTAGDTIHLQPVAIRVEKYGMQEPGPDTFRKKNAAGEIREKRKF